jgi:hypothetical protein
MFQIKIVEFNYICILRYVLIVFMQWGIFDKLHKAGFVLHVK